MRCHDQQQPEDQDAVVGDVENDLGTHVGNRRFSQPIIALLVSCGCSCCVQCPHLRIRAFSKSGTKRSMPSAIFGDRIISSSAMIISEGCFTFCAHVPESCQLREKLRYQLMPPVKPVRVNVSTK